MNVDLTLPVGFNNRVRLFPLPNLVLFPGVMQGLHIFEPRYRELMEDAVNGDQLITMAIYKPKWETSLVKDPPIYPTVCIGKIVTHAKMDDGRFNLLLLGVKRARVVGEVDSGKLYREADLELIEDRCEMADADLDELRQNLQAEFRNLIRSRSLDENTIQHLLGDNLPFSLFVDLACYSLKCDVEDRLRVLEAEDAGLRGEIVLELIRKQLSTQNSDVDDQDFPPDFSLN